LQETVSKTKSVCFDEAFPALDVGAVAFSFGFGDVGKGLVFDLVDDFCHHVGIAEETLAEVLEFVVNLVLILTLEDLLKTQQLQAVAIVVVIFQTIHFVLFCLLLLDHSVQILHSSADKLIV
jgi:hypothetical protein